MHCALKEAFRSENLKAANYSEDVDINGSIIILEWILGKWSGNVWIGCICHRIGTSGGLL
jgi:hypothetical protein